MRDSRARAELRPLRVQSYRSWHRSGWYFLLLRKLCETSGNPRRPGSFDSDSEDLNRSSAAATTLFLKTRQDLPFFHKSSCSFVLLGKLVLEIAIGKRNQTTI